MKDLISKQAVIALLKRENAKRRDIEEVLITERNIELIRDMPVVFNVEKVVEETGEVLNDLNVVEVLSHVEPYTTIQRPLENFLDSFKEEIRRIVKRGGVE